MTETGGELPIATLADEIETPGEGQVRALLTSAGNPVLSTPNGARLDRAFAKLDFMVSIDPYLNETTRHAHVILPPCSPLQRPHYDLALNAFAVENVAKWVDPTLPLGVVSLPQGWGHHRDGVRATVTREHAGVSINDLTDDRRVDRLTGNAAFSAVPVEVAACS
jgi:anaerobic selenocysteine-containing dehydrogenase